MYDSVSQSVSIDNNQSMAGSGDRDGSMTLSLTGVLRPLKQATTATRRDRRTYRLTTWYESHRI